VPRLLPEETAALSASPIQDVVENFLVAGRSVDAHGFVADPPPGSEVLLRELEPRELELLAPRLIGLGVGLHAAEDQLAAGYGAACLVNAHSPTLPTALLVETVERLRLPGDRVVLGPPSDGGYYLIGLKHPHPRLFQNIDWSAERVFGQTVERAATLGLAIETLPLWYDVDDPASLRWLCDEVLFGRRSPLFAGEGYSAPRVARLLRRLAASDAAARLGVDRLTDEGVP
jgi:uncharacterized protein